MISFLLNYKKKKNIIIFLKELILLKNFMMKYIFNQFFILFYQN